MKPIRLILADDHKIVREGLRLLIESQTEMQVVGEANNGLEVLELVRTLHPEVIVMDLSMPDLSGLQTTTRLRIEWPEVRVVVLTVHEDESYLRQLCAAGAAGYVLKRSAGTELIDAIRAVAGGGLYFDRALAARALASQVGRASSHAQPQAADLSDREREVLRLVARGFSNKEIAAKLVVSVKTVETYRARIGQKLGLLSRAAMVQFALQQGWLQETGA